jgi:hypothetical protein
MKPSDLPEPQYEEIRVEVDYGDGWVDAIGWKTLEEAKAVWPSARFRKKIPPTPGPGYISTPYFGYVPNYPPPLEGNENKTY